MNNVKFSVILLTTFLVFSNQVYAELKKQKTPEQSIVELIPSDFEPSFTRDTVIKLNGIVSRSLDIINEYDAIVGAVRSATSHSSMKSKTAQSEVLAEQEVARIDALSKRSKLVLSDMTGAVKSLKESDEYYNGVILAGMFNFVQDVEREISAQTEILMKTQRRHIK